MTDFKALQAEFTPQINQFLSTTLANEISDPDFSQIMAYSVLAGGKRLRPLLFLATLTTLGHQIGEPELRAACGIELIHTYSLIHDDLPAMDNDDYRRGRLTSHKKWGEAAAILAGDALLPLGINWIARLGNSELAEIITEAIGPNGMVLGQYLDMDSTNNSVHADDENYIDQMEWLKTGCLIEASVEMAAVYANASQAQLANLLTFSQKFGRAYQIYDDLIDVIETEQEAGKATHKDAEVGRNNTLTLLGIKQSRNELIKLIGEAKLQLASFDDQVLAGFLDLYQKVL